MKNLNAILLTLSLAASSIKASEMPISPEHKQDTIELVNMIFAKEILLKLLDFQLVKEKLGIDNETLKAIMLAAIEKSKNKVVKVYAEVYNHEEIRDLLQFFKSDVGQKYLVNMPNITDKMTQIIQKEVKESFFIIIHKKA